MLTKFGLVELTRYSGLSNVDLDSLSLPILSLLCHRDDMTNLTREKISARPDMADTLATVKEEFNVAQVATLSQMLAPRYMTRSRVTIDSTEDGTLSIQEKRLADTVSETTVEDKFDRNLDEAPSTTSSATATKESKTMKSAPKRRKTAAGTPVTSETDGSSPPSKKRGRHKEYTAPTGVWKTNGGFISTIYVGNRRIYGPLRDNPEDAGVDRQKLIEAKPHVKNEMEMRSFISALKASSSPATVNVEDPTNYYLIIAPGTPINMSSRPIIQNKTTRPVLSTITSSTTTIESSISEDVTFDVPSEGPVEE
jgi:hypothetical protein